jgi:DNA primase catalytic core
MNDEKRVNLDKLKSEIPIKELAKQLGLEIRNNQARCYNLVAHKNKDQHFSLGLDIEKNRYKCFGCGESGSVIDLYMAIKGVDFKIAVQELSNQFGVGGPRQSRRAVQATTPIKEDTREVKDSREFYDVYEEFIYDNYGLDLEADKSSLDYLTQRGFTQDTLEHFCVSSVKSYEKTSAHMKRKFKIERLKASGLFNENGNLIFYKHRILFPFFDDGRIIYIQGRTIGQPTNSGCPKYMFLKHHSLPLFNLDGLKGFTNGDEVHIAEGIPDTMMLYQNGLNAVGVLGVNNFRPEMTSLFKEFKVVACLDNDLAGKEATKKLAELFFRQGQAISSVKLPDGVKDIVEFFNQ